MIWGVVFALSLSAAPSAWQELKEGIHYRRVQLVAKPTHSDGILHVVRIDPARARMVVRAASGGDGKNRTARRWAEGFGSVAVINAGMYDSDFSTHVGFLRVGRHINSARWDPRYKSVFLVDDGRAEILDVIKKGRPLKKAHTIVQNLRLVSDPGKNVWAKDSRRWSEAALAVDSRGRILFLFCRTPLSMWQLNQRLLRSDLQIVRAQHLEGGPEASLSIHSKTIHLDLSGSYETGFNENDNNHKQWPLPNVIAVE